MLSKKSELELLTTQVKDWIKENPDQFKPNCTNVHDEENLKRMERFAGSPIEYLIERIEINKAVLKDYHKLYHTILMAGVTGFFAYGIARFTILLVENISAVPSAVTETTTGVNAQLAGVLGPLLGLIVLIVGGFIFMRCKLQTKLLKWSGLLRVIRDSEIEIYYLSKILESREIGLTKTIDLQSKPDKKEMNKP